MGILDRFRGPTPAAPAARSGDSKYRPPGATNFSWNLPRNAVVLPVGDGRGNVVGESHYLAAFEKVFGKRSKGGVNLWTHVVLIREPKNTHDPNAITVQVKGQTLGYIAAADAVRYAPILDRLAGQKKVGACRAAVGGGWDRGKGNTGHFGVTLYVAEDPEASDL